MINTWKYNSNKFKKYTIFENTTYDNNKYILRDYNYFLFYTKDKKYPIIGEYAIWIDDTAIAHMRDLISIILTQLCINQMVFLKF
jgi:hypothetical protein